MRRPGVVRNRRHQYNGWPVDQQASNNPSESPTTPSRDRAPGLGRSAVELGGQRGIGPLSPLAAHAWHGQAKPCVSCGQLVRRTTNACDQCGQDLSARMLFRMQSHCGPWYVLEHVRPFPGVTLDRLVLQARRGVLTPTTIVRGPATYHQWRFAGETPMLSKHLGLCWRCQASVGVEDRLCPVCRVNLDGETDVLFKQARPELVAQAAGPPPPVRPHSVTPAAAGPDRLEELTAAVRSPQASPGLVVGAAPQRIVGIRVGWLVGGMLLLLIVGLCWVIRARLKQTGPSKGPAVSVMIGTAEPERSC